MSSSPEAAEDSSCIGADECKNCERVKALPLAWCCSLERGMPTQIPSFPLDCESKERDPSRRDLVLLQIVALISTHSFPSVVE
ncbi:hypothetical protein TNCV_2778411 [Trichonephila clavipes]|nr:hypothetical protein TNCV_2778411 [Trichonephila clavipes]